MAGHKCPEEMLFLRKKNESFSQKVWVHVTSLPPKCNLSDGLCDCTAQGCRRPHNAYEQELWTWHSKNNVSSQDLVRDMRSSSPVRAMYIVSKLHGNQRYVNVCKTCYDKDDDNPAMKNLHRPICKNGHDWAKNELCVFEEVNANGTTTYSKQEMDNVVTPQDLVIECSRTRQRQISELNRPQLSETVTHRPIQLDAVSSASSSSEEDETDATCFESIQAREYVGEDDGLNIPSPDGDVFYDTQEKHDLENLLNSHTDIYKRCTLRLTGRHSAVCTPEVVANNFAKIEIKGRTNCGPTFDGDNVVVEMFHTKELDKESTVLSGRVAGVLGGCVKRRSHVFVCTVDEYLSCLMVPRCGTAPKVHIIDSYVKEKLGPIRNQLVTVYKIRDGNLQLKCIERLNPKNRQSKLFVVRYIKWETRFMYPLGCVVKAIEPGRDLQSGQRILNLQYQVQQQFPADVVSCAEDSREPELLDGRRDLREEYTFTIDPPGCTDIDDALSVRRLDRNGHDFYEVDVHIADVTHYVQQADPIDIESRRRGTTFYPAVGCSAFHMLPQRLSEDLCSLLPGKDRLTLSVRLTLDNDSNLIEPNPTISRTVINSNEQLMYTEVHEMLSTKHSDEVDEELRRRLTWLHQLSQKLREKRLQDKRFFSEYDGLFDIEDHAADAHELIEEFMVLANREVAKFLIGKFPDCTPLRRQEEPKEDDMKSWRMKHAAVARGTFYFQSFNDLMAGCDEREDKDFPLLTDTTRQLTEAVAAGDMARATTLVSLEQLHPEFALLFPSWYGIQERSEYIRSGNGASCRHFTLREDVYTHFTSPIRRYFDTVVHRLVKAAIDGQPSPYTGEEMDQMCRHLNYQTRQQKKYDNDLNSLKRACSLNTTAMFLPGVVEDIRDGHFSVYLPHLRLRKEVKYGLLGVRAALTAECVEDSPPGKITLYWSRKIFDAGGCPTHARTSCAVSESLRLDTYTHVDRVPRNSWNDVRRVVSTSDTESLLPALSNMLADARSSSNELPPEVTSEMKMDERLWRKACDFQLSLKTNDTMLLQVFVCSYFPL